MTVSVVFAIAGVIALLFGIVGGGIKAKEIEVPLLSVRTRLVTILVGVILIGFTIWLENDKSTSVVSTPTTLATTSSSLTSISPTATIQISTTASQRILFEEDFSSNNNGWNEGVVSDDLAEMKNEFVNGHLRRTVTSNTGGILERTWLPGITLQDFQLNFDVVVVDAPDDAVVCVALRRSSDNKNYYHLYFGVNGIYGVKLVENGHSTTIYEAKLPSEIKIKEGEQNKFAITIQKSLITISVNSIILTTVNDSGLTKSGNIGLGVGLDNANETVIVEYDNLVIWNTP